MWWVCPYTSSHAPFIQICLHKPRRVTTFTKLTGVLPLFQFSRLSYTQLSSEGRLCLKMWLFLMGNGGGGAARGRR